MAKKKKTKKKTGAFQFVKLLFGVSLTVCLLFAGVRAIDYFNLKNRHKNVSPNLFFLTPGKTTGKKPGLNRDTDLEKISPEFLPSFFKTLKESGEKENFSLHGIEDFFKPLKKQQHPLVNNGEKTGDITTKKSMSSASGLTYRIQVGSFRNPDKADMFAEKLAEKGYDVHVSTTRVPGSGTVYRVRIGHYKDLEKAQETASILHKKEKLSVFITTR